MKSKKITTGSGYPKKKIIELIRVFGLTIDYDQWDVKDKGWMRLRWERDRESRNIILYKDHLEVEANREEWFLKKMFQDYLLEMGETEFKKKLNDLIKID